MAEEIDLENCNFWNFRSPVTLTLTLHQVIQHNVVHHSSTSTYIRTKFHWSRKNFLWTDTGMDGQTDIPPSNGIRSTRKIAKNSPSAHHRTTLSACIFATKARIDNRKKNLLNMNISSTCSHNMVNFGPLAAEIGLPVWGTPANFNGLCMLASLLHRHHSRRSTKLCTMFGRLLGWYTIYTFSEALDP